MFVVGTKVYGLELSLEPKVFFFLGAAMLLGQNCAKHQFDLKSTGHKGVAV